MLGKGLTRTFAWSGMFLLAGALPVVAVDFASQVKPLLRSKCWKCHAGAKVKGGVRLDTRSGVLKEIVSGNSGGSNLIHVVEDGDMPPKGPGLSGGQIGILKSWIDAGAPWGSVASTPAGGAAQPPGRAPKTAPGARRTSLPQYEKGMKIVEPPENPYDLTPRPVGPVKPPPAPEAPIVTVMPSAAGTRVDFGRDIQPILRRSCLKCHGPNRPRSRFRLDNRESALKGGEFGIAIVPGSSAESRMVKYAARMVEGQEMPPLGEGIPLSDREVGLLRAWIDQGAEWGGTADVPDFEFSITSGARWISVDGNEQKFRELNWRREGWSGGVTRFAMEKWLDFDTKLTAEGSLDAPGTIDFTLALDRQDLGFFRAGVQQVRRYYNNYGGYYEPFAATGQAAFRLDRDLHLDVGRIWTEVGINRPDWPQIVLGYEYRFRDGTKSTLHWGPSTVGGETRNIFPAYKSIDEEVHILRADVKFDWAGLQLENNFMLEYFDLDTRREEAGPGSFGAYPDQFVTTGESHHSTQLSNAFSVQKEIADWWLLSGGYYYSHIDSDAEFSQDTVDGAGTPVAGQHWFSQPIVLEWHTHIFNASTRLGPWEGFTLSGGIQNNWERKEAMGTATLFLGLPNPMIPIDPFFVSTATSERDTVTTTEHAALRYDAIPHTVLFAEMELQQENSDYTEDDPGVFRGLSRDTHASSRDRDYRAGFTVSPWRRVSLNSHYRYSKEVDRYDHDRDEEFGFPGAGYSAFITGRDIETQEVMARLNVRPTPWLTALLTYQLQSSDYKTDTDPVFFGAPEDTVGGWLLAGEYDANIYSVNVVLTPWERLSMNGNFSYHDSRTRTASNDDPAVEDFEGDFYSVLVGANYRLGDKTSLMAHYSFARGDFSQDNAAEGLPLGIEYEQHMVQAGLSTQIGSNMSAGVHYLFQHYEEPSAGGFNDYTAHGVFANFTLDWK